jgi:hypothetical protein
MPGVSKNWWHGASSAHGEWSAGWFERSMLTWKWRSEPALKARASKLTTSSHGETYGGLMRSIPYEAPH